MNEQGIPYMLHLVGIHISLFIINYDNYFLLLYLFTSLFIQNVLKWWLELRPKFSTISSIRIFSSTF